MAKEEEVKKWKNKLSVSDRKWEQLEKELKEYKNYYRGKQWSDADTDINSFTNKVTDNMVFSNIKTILPAINLNNPRFYSTAKKKPYMLGDGALFDTLTASVLVEILLDYYLKELKIKQEVDKCVLDALIGHWGIMQFGYSVETEKIKDNKLLESNELIKSESPFIMRRSPLDFRCDPYAKDHSLNDAEWIAFRWVKKLEDIKDNPNYKNTADLKSNVRLDTKFNNEKYIGQSDSWEKDVELNKDWERVEGWDVWDKVNKRLFTIVDNHSKFLAEKDWPLQLEGFPIETIFFNANPDELFPLADIEIYKKQQDELNRIRSLQLDHIRRISQRKYASRRSTLDMEEKRKLTHGPDGTIIEIDGDPTTSLVPIRDATISQDIYMVARLLKEDIRESSGVPQFEKGIAEKFETATEPSLISQSLSIRRAERIATVEGFYIRIAKKLLQILQQTMNETSVPLNDRQFEQVKQYADNKLQKIVGEKADVVQPWLNLSKDDIQGEYEFEIAVGSTQPVNQQKRKQDALTLAQVLQGNPFIDGYEATRKLLEVFEDKDLEKLLKKPEQVLQEQMQQGKMQVLAEQMKNAPKRETDLEKTKIKSQTTLVTSLMDMIKEKKDASI